MKKLFTSAALGLCMALSAMAADKPSNEAFYLVGTMNSWSCPVDESVAASWAYKLTDEDGDGVYTGSFEIPEGQLEFKVFSTLGDWTTADYYGSDASIYLLQEPFSLLLSPGYGSRNITVKNWNGGTFTISASWGGTYDGAPMPLIVMEGSNQPSEILKPANDAFYLVGGIAGGKTLTAENASEWPYRLEDKDSDGIYTGEFDLPAGEFSFTMMSDPGNLDSQYGYYGSVYLYNDDFTVDLYKYPDPITIPNWEGGKFKISVQWIGNPYIEYEWYPRMTVTGPSQPARPAFPDIYVIGDFNGWKLPTSADLNGAKPFDQNIIYSDCNVEYIEMFVEANGSLKLGICQLDPATGKYLFYAPNYSQPFTLYSYEINDNGDTRSSTAMIDFTGSWIDTTDKDKYTMTIKDWKGGKIALRPVFPYDKEKDHFLYVYGFDGPPSTAPDGQFYYLIESDGMKELHTVDLRPYATHFFNASGHEVSIILTNENSLTPAPENCWGTDVTLMEAGFNDKNTAGFVPLIKGGEPVKMAFPAAGRMALGFNISTSTVHVDLDYVGGPFKADKIYICGHVMTAPDGEKNNFLAPNASNMVKYDEYWRLDEVSPGVFSKAYYVPEKDTNYEWGGGVDNLPQFRFFSELLGWTTEASLGSTFADFTCMPVDLSEGRKECYVIQGGLGNWGMNTLSDGYKWESSWVRIVVDTNTGLVSFEKVTSGIDDVVVDGEVSESWYNLQGVKVDKPEKGLYIHVRNGKSAVELVK